MIGRFDMIARWRRLQQAMGKWGGYMLVALGLLAGGRLALARAHRAGRRKQRLQSKLKQQAAEIKAHEKHTRVRNELRSDNDVIERLRRNGL